MGRFLALRWAGTCAVLLTLLGVASAKTPRVSQFQGRDTILEAKAEAKRPKVDEVQTRIVGGGKASSGEYPWMVALLDRNESDRYYAQYCGASLIHPYWVLTAAHCVSGDSPEVVDALVGGRDLDSGSEGERIPVVEIIVHPDYDPVSLDFDIALLRLATPSSAPVLRLNSDVALEQPDRIATILGWGALDEDLNSFPSVLQEALVPLVSLGDANASDVYDGTLTQNMLAAGNLITGGVDSCQGDSGGPLIVEDLDGEWALAGIVSFGEGCARPDFPGIYTRVSRLRSWVFGHLFPDYADWEMEQQLFGEARDFDGDGRNHFSEFALDTDPSRADGDGISAVVVAGSPVFRFRRPLGSADEVRFELSQKPALNQEWGAWPIEGNLGASDIVGESETLSIAFPEGEQGFMRLDLSPAVDWVHTPRLLGLPGGNYSRLAADLPSDAFGRRYQDYLFEGLPEDRDLRVFARSAAADMRLEWYHAETGALLGYSQSNNYFGSGEQVDLTTSAPLRLRVLSEQPSYTGSASYRVGAYVRDSALPSVSPGQTVNGRLRSSDEPDPLWLPDIYYKKDYLLEIPEGFSRSLQVSLSSKDFDAYLELVDLIAGVALDENDDIDVNSGNYDARLTISPAAFGEQLIRVTTADTFQTGSFVLVVESL